MFYLWGYEPLPLKSDSHVRVIINVLKQSAAEGTLNLSYTPVINSTRRFGFSLE